MLDGIKRLFSASPGPQRGGDDVAAWVGSRRYVYRQVQSGDGFVVEGRTDGQPWRLEWGPSQRDYIAGQELRLRADMGLPSELQLAVFNRLLQEAMEKAVFEAYVEGVQTLIDNDTPPEVRWLVMFPKLGGQEMGRLKDRYAALANAKPWLLGWLEGPMSAALGALALPPAQPFVLTMARGRLTLRTPMAEPDTPGFDALIRVFETAIREARRVGSESHQSTTPSLWSATDAPTMPPPGGAR